MVTGNGLSFMFSILEIGWKLYAAKYCMANDHYLVLYRIQSRYSTYYNFWRFYCERFTSEFFVSLINKFDCTKLFVFVNRHSTGLLNWGVVFRNGWIHVSQFYGKDKKYFQNCSLDIDIIVPAFLTTLTYLCECTH